MIELKNLDLGDLEFVIKGLDFIPVKLMVQVEFKAPNDREIFIIWAINEAGGRVKIWQNDIDFGVTIDDVTPDQFVKMMLPKIFGIDDTRGDDATVED